MQAEDMSPHELHNLALPLTVCLLIQKHAPTIVCMHDNCRMLQTMVGTVCANATSNASQHQTHTTGCAGSS